MTRRSFLALGCLAIAFTAPHRTRAATEAEAAGYAGTTAGGWVCGPVGRANYAGVGARVRVSENKARHGGGGGLVELGGAAEHESVEIIRCEDDPCERPPPDRTHLGGHLRAGYMGPFSKTGPSFGVEGGATLFQAWEDESDTTPALAWFPDVELAYRPRSEVVKVVLGVGSPSVTHYRRPGAYGGTDVSAGPVDVQLRAGAFRAGPATADAEFRADGAVVVPVAGPLSIRAGGSLMTGGDGAEAGGEGQLGVRAEL